MGSAIDSTGISGGRGIGDASFDSTSADTIISVGSFPSDSCFDLVLESCEEGWRVSMGTVGTWHFEIRFVELGEALLSMLFDGEREGEGEPERF